MISTVSADPGTGPAPLFQLAADAQLPVAAVHVSVAASAEWFNCRQTAEAAETASKPKRRRFLVFSLTMSSLPIWGSSGTQLQIFRLERNAETQPKRKDGRSTRYGPSSQKSTKSV